MFDQNSGVSPRRSSSVSRPAQAGLCEDALDEQGVEVHERGLQKVQGEHRGLLVFAVGAGELAVLAVEDDGVGAVPVLDDLEAVVDLAPQRGVGEVVADERGADGAAEFLERLVGGVLGAAAGEAPQHLFGLGGPEPQGGGVPTTSLRETTPSVSRRRGQRRAAARARGGGPRQALEPPSTGAARASPRVSRAARAAPVGYLRTASER